MKLSIGVFFGGKACEHEISCISANQAMHALDLDKYDLVPVYIAKNGDMYTGEELLELKNYDNLDALCNKLLKVSITKDGEKTYLRPVKEGLFKSKVINLDVAFLVMHGTNGEDGTLQGLMEMMNIPYTSSGVMASSIAQDKVIMKQVLSYEKLPLVDWFYFTRYDFKNDLDTIKEKAKALSYPLILKPANLGSSIGIEIVHSEDELISKIKSTLEYDNKVLVEKYIPSFKEINCSVIGDDESFKTSVLEQVSKDDEILDFESKYLGNGKGSKMKGAKSGSKGMASASRIVPAPIDEEMTKNIKDMAIKAYKALNAYGVCRIDFMVDDDNNIYLTELNNIPGSLAFYLWDKEGINFSEECDLLINNAIKRYRNKERLLFSFDTNILSTFKGGK